MGGQGPYLWLTNSLVRSLLWASCVVSVMKAKSFVVSGFMRECKVFYLSNFVVPFTHESLEDSTCYVIVECVPFEV